MKKIVFSVLGVMASIGMLEAGTIFLVNDSPYPLRAVVRANDGKFLGEVVINQQNTNKWTDGFAGLPGGLQDVRVNTPYKVLWYCLEGAPFSQNNFVATGTEVTAMNGDGPRECHPQRQRLPESEIPAPPLPIPGEGTAEY